MATKKVGSAGRFGARYGARIRKRVKSIEEEKNKKQYCTVCNTGVMKRLSTGIYLCKKCKAKIAGKAYTLK